jgi:hypothetical protein
MDIPKVNMGYYTPSRVNFSGTPTPSVGSSPSLKSDSGSASEINPIQSTHE